MPHLDDGRIEELLDGEIASGELAAIQEHLASCESCRARLDTARALADEAGELLFALDDAPSGAAVDVIAPPARRATRWPRRLAHAATLVIAAGAGYLARGPFVAPETPSPIETTAATATPVQATAPVESPPGPVAGDAPATRSESFRDAAPAIDAPPPPRASAPMAPPRAEEALRAGERTAEVARGEVRALQADRDARDVDTEPVARRFAQTPAGAVGNSLAAGRTADAVDAAQRLAAEPTVRDQVTSKQVIAPDTIDLAEAVERLGGSIRLVDGRFPVRIEALGDEVLVVYRGPGEFRLAQSRIDGRITWRLVVPEGFPADSLAAIRRRVND